MLKQIFGKERNGFFENNQQLKYQNARLYCQA